MEADDNKKMNQNIFLSFVVGIVLGSGITWLLLGSEVLSPSVDDIGDLDNTDTVLIDDSGNTDNGAGEVVATGVNRIVVDNQLEGERVRLVEVEVTEASWVVVHEEVEGSLGNALGAARYDPGSYTGGYVDLLRNTETGSMYHVILYRDNGDKEFNLDDDLVVVDSLGEKIGVTFEAIRVDRKTN